MRRCRLLPLAVAGLLALACAPEETRRAAAPARAPGDWPRYAGDAFASRYTPLDQIDAERFDRLEVVWRWASDDLRWVEEDFPALPQPRRPKPAPNVGNFQLSPLVVDGAVYGITAIGQVFSLDAGSGALRWIHDPRSYLDEAGVYRFHTVPKHRGVSLWRDEEGRARVLVPTFDAWLLALDAETGAPIEGFGRDGRVDLMAGLRGAPARRVLDYFQSSPGVVVGDVIVVGSSINDRPRKIAGTPGDLRAYDVRTGALRWRFHVVPEGDEPGAETWEGGSWRRGGAVNVWGPMSADPALGAVYAATSTPHGDFYGKHRPGDNLYGESVLCIDAATGGLRWARQLIHHGLWDYDLPAAPNLLDLRIGGREVHALALATKQGFVFVFDRVTGEPLWPIEERPVPRSDIPGERSAPTQPFPTRPPPFERQGASAEDLVSYTPELEAAARRIFQRFRAGPLFTPPSREGTLVVPGPVGGASWQGAAVDPETGALFVPSVTSTKVIAMKRSKRSEFEWDRRPGTLTLGAGPKEMELAQAFARRSLPFFEGPLSRITAYDLATGTIRWQVANGDGANRHPKLAGLDLPPLGSGAKTCVLVTPGLVVAADGGDYATPALGRPILRAFDKASGAIVAEAPLPARAIGCPASYLHEGRQRILVTVADPDQPNGGSPGLVALGLPERQ